MRDNKGNRWEKHFNDYTVIDLETCGLIGDDRNSVIELAAIKVRDGVVVGEFSSLINPMRIIPSKVINKTGIDNAMVAEAPVIRDVMYNYLDFIGDDILVGFNINTFDYNILYDLANSLYNRIFSNDFVDVLYAAKRSIRGIDNYRLTTICNLYNIDFTGAHRALKDCYLTKAVYDRIYDQFGAAAFDGKAHAVSSQESCTRKEPHYSEETMQLKTLQSILENIIEDNVVTEDEVNALVDWMELNISLKGNYPFDRVFDLLEKVLEDGVVDDEELKMLLDKFTDYTSPTKSTCSSVGELTNKHFVLTGEFSYGPKSDVSEYIVSNGGVVDDTVKKCTQYVVIGSLGSQAWKNGVYGSKIKKAMELKDKGLDIELISEDDFFNETIADSIEEPLSLFDTSWMDIIKDAMERIAKIEELPEGSLQLVENLSRDKEKITSYSVAVLKPDYPHGVNPNGKAKNNLINIKSILKKTDLVETLVVSIPDSILPMVKSHFPDLSLVKKKSDPITRANIAVDSKDLNVFFNYVIKSVLDIYFAEGSDAFGCCSRYEACSDAKKCLHENKLYARNCIYGARLAEGQIYYGKNRNI